MVEQRSLDIGLFETIAPHENPMSPDYESPSQESILEVVSERVPLTLDPLPDLIAAHRKDFIEARTEGLEPQEIVRLGELKKAREFFGDNPEATSFEPPNAKIILKETPEYNVFDFFARYGDYLQQLQDNADPIRGKKALSTGALDQLGDYVEIRRVHWEKKLDGNNRGIAERAQRYHSIFDSFSQQIAQLKKDNRKAPPTKKK